MMLLCKYLEAIFCILSTLNYSVIYTGGMGTGGYTLMVGNTLTPLSVQILGYSSQSTAPILNTPLY